MAIEKSLLEELKKKMETEKESITEMLKGFAKEDTKPEGDWDTSFPKTPGENLEEAADSVEEYENLLPIEHVLETKLQNINIALGKVEKGEYGNCENCSKEISQERLKVLPEARTCENCKK